MRKVGGRISGALLGVFPLGGAVRLLEGRDEDAKTLWEMILEKWFEFGGRGDFQAGTILHPVSAKCSSRSSSVYPISQSFGQNAPSTQSRLVLLLVRASCNLVTYFPIR